MEATLSGFQPGAARELFQFHGAGGFWRYDVSPDGDRFLVTDPLDEDLASPVTLITDSAAGHFLARYLGGSPRDA